MEFEERHIVLFVVYLNMVLYATCYQIQRPLEPVRPSINIKLLKMNRYIHVRLITSYCHI